MSVHFVTEMSLTDSYFVLILSIYLSVTCLYICRCSHAILSLICFVQAEPGPLISCARPVMSSNMGTTKIQMRCQI